MRSFLLLLFLQLWLTTNLTAIDSNSISYQENEVCGVMATALTSYESITTNNNDVYKTCTISVKDFNLEEDSQQNVTCYDRNDVLCSCDPSVSECSSNLSCTIVPEPEDTLTYTVYETTLTDNNTISNDITFTEEEYGNYSFTQHGTNINFAPTAVYSDANVNYMLLGEFRFEDNDQTLTFDGGDYYFESFEIDRDTNGNVNQINICAKDDIRIFIKDTFVYSGNHINDSDCGGNIFIYVEGNSTIDANGGGSSDIPIFIYTKGDTSIENSGDSNDWTGAITSEGVIDVSGQNINFIYDEDAAAYGFGSCPIPSTTEDVCYESPIVTGFDLGPIGFFSGVTTPIKNISGEDISYVTVIKSFDGISMDVMSKIAIDDTEKTLEKYDDEAEKDSNLSASFANFNASGLFDQGLVYRIDEFGANDTHTIYDYSSFSFDMSKVSYDVTYMKDGQTYYSEIYPCGGGSSTVVITGPFDAWDTDSDITHRDIKTKISYEDFNLTIVSLNDTYDAIEAKEGIDIEYRLYDLNTSSAVTEWQEYNASSTSDGASETKLFSGIVGAYRDVRVQFKFCLAEKVSTSWSPGNNQTTSDETQIILYPLSYCKENSIDVNTSTFSTDNFAIRPYALAAFSTNQYKRAAEDFNLTLKAINQNDFKLLGNSSASGKNKDSISSINFYNAQLNDLQISSQFYQPTSAEITQMQNDTGKTDVATCPQSGTFTINNATDTFNNGQIEASLKFSETGILDINISEKVGTEWAKVDSDDTPDAQRYITPSSVTYDESDISVKTLLLFVPYKLETSATYNTTSSQTWLYMNDINSSNSSFTTPKHAAFITYTIVAKNKDGDITKNFTKTCFPDVSESNCPRVNGLKLNTTFDLFLDATLNTTQAVSISLYTEDNASSAIYTPNKNISLVQGDNQIQEWISPFEFTDGRGEARVYFNVDRRKNVAINPVNIKLIDSNTSTSWMSNPGSPKEFTGITLNTTKTFLYGRTHVPRQRFIGQDANVSMYYEVYCDGSNCDKTLLPNGLNSKTTDDPRWFINSNHTAVSGLPGSVNQKTYSVGNGYVIQTTAATGNAPDHVELHYNGTRGYPYKTTMENNASSWLLYNQFNANTQYNEFEVEFNNDDTTWAGHRETDSNTNRNAADKTNRRLMW